MEDYNVEVTFTVGAESEDDAREIVSWYLTVAAEEVNLHYAQESFPDNIIGKAKSVTPSVIRTIATPR